MLTEVALVASGRQRRPPFILSSCLGANAPLLNVGRTRPTYSCLHGFILDFIFLSAFFPFVCIGLFFRAVCLLRGIFNACCSF